MKQLMVLALASVVAVSASAGGPAKGSFNDKKDGHGHDHGHDYGHGGFGGHGFDHGHGFDNCAPVPEADSIAMVASGLGLVGVVVARRRKK